MARRGIRIIITKCPYLLTPLEAEVETARLGE
jgi:hypothetical protein